MNAREKESERERERKRERESEGVFSYKILEGSGVFRIHVLQSCT